MFILLFFTLIFQFFASAGTLGSLVAQNLFTNSATGWYIRLDWTAMYTYIVTIASVITTFILLLSGLARRRPGGGGGYNIFNPLMLFSLSFIFSILWIVIAGFAYRNPLPMKYPCGIFRHLRGNLEMLGLTSGKSIIDEGGLLIGICQASKAFLVLSGIGLGLWLAMLVFSCASMVTGIDKRRVARDPSEKSHRSVRTLFSGSSKGKSAPRTPQQARLQRGRGRDAYPEPHCGRRCTQPGKQGRACRDAEIHHLSGLAARDSDRANPGVQATPDIISGPISVYNGDDEQRYSPGAPATNNRYAANKTHRRQEYHGRGIDEEDIENTIEHRGDVSDDGNIIDDERTDDELPHDHYQYSDRQYETGHSSRAHSHSPGSRKNRLRKLLSRD